MKKDYKNIINKNKLSSIKISNSWRKALYISGIIILFFTSLQTTFYFFAKPILKNYIEKRVVSSTDSLYTIHFDDIKVNLLSRSFVISKLKITPDTAVYKKYIKENKYKKSIFEVKLDTFRIKKINLFGLFGKKRKIKIKEIYFDTPEIQIIAQPNQDNTNKDKNISLKSYKNEILPQLFNKIYSLSVNRFKIKDGNFDFLKIDKLKNKETFSADNITITFIDFYLNKNNYLQEKIFFTDNYEIRIDGYSLNLKDKIHTLKAEIFYISLTEKKIILKNIQLLPLQIPKEKLPYIKENFMEINIPKIVFSNTNFSEIYFGKKMHLSKAFISKPEINIFKQKTKNNSENKNDSSIKKNIDLYKLFKGVIEFTQIDTINLKDAKLNVFNNFHSNKPDIKIGKLNIKLQNFKVDSISYIDTTKIFYADNIFMDVQNFHMKLKDNIHYLSAKQLQINSKLKKISVHKVDLIPDYSQKESDENTNKGYNKITIPKAELSGVNIQRYANFKELNISKFLILNPEIDILKYAKRNKKKKAQTSDLSQLTKYYLKNIKIDTINLISGKFNYKNIKGNKRITTTGNLNIFLKKFDFDPSQNNVKDFFYADNFKIEFNNYNFSISENAHKIVIDKLRISSFNSEIYLKNFRYIPVENKNITELLQKYNKSLLINFQIPELKIKQANLHKALLNNNLKISNINIFSPKLVLTSFPNINTRKSKKEYLKILKSNAVKNIIQKASITKVILSGKYKNKENDLEKLIQKKVNAVNKIKEYSINNINSIFIRIKKINTNDSIYKSINEIKNIALANINTLGNDSLSVFQIDSIRKYVFIKINDIKTEEETPKINKEELIADIGDFLNIIDIDSLNIYDGQVTYKQKKNNTTKIVFHNSLSLKLLDFYFNNDSLELESDRLLFSKDIEIKLKNYKFYLTDNVHTINVKDFKLSTLNSKIELNNITIKPDTTKAEYKKITALIYSYIPNITLMDFNMSKIYYENYLDIEKLFIKKPVFSIVNQNIKEKNDSLTINEAFSQILMPGIIKKLKVGTLNIDSGKVHITQKVNNTEITTFKSDFNINIENINIDSVSHTANNPLFIPAENINSDLWNLSFAMPDSLHFITADKLKISTKNKNLYLKNFKISYNADINKYKYLLNAGKTSLLNINLPDLNISGIDFSRIYINKELIANEIFIDKPYIKIETFPILKQQNIKENKFKLNDLDLYKHISINFNKLSFNKFIFNNLNLNIDTHDKGEIKSLSLEKISGIITNLLIDSTAQKTKFLYSDDITLTIRDYSKILKNGELTFGANQISISTNKNEIQIDTFYLTPNYTDKEYSEMIGNDKAITGIKADNLTLNQVNLIELADNEKLISESAVLTGLDLHAYKNKNLPHKDTVKQRFVDRIMDLPFYIYIKNTYINKSQITYEELSKGAVVPGLILLTDIRANIYNITNDSLLIASGINTVVNAKCKFMGQGDLNTIISYQLNHPDKLFTMFGNLTNTDLTLLNRYLNDAMNVEIKSGKIDNMTFNLLFIDSIAKGTVKMKYQDVNAYLLKKRVFETEVREKYKVLSFLGNFLFIRKNNPKFGIFMKTGKAGYFHDWSYGEVKFWAMALVSGVQSTIVFDSKDTRKIKRETRSEIRKKKNKQQ